MQPRRKPLRIGIDCRTILNPTVGERAGIGYYIYQLVKHLLKIDKKNSYVLFFDHRFTDFKEFKRKRVEIVPLPYSQYKRYLPLAYSHLLVSRIFTQAKLDLLHAPANVVPLQYHKPVVVTVHDLAIYEHPEWFPARQDFSIKILVPNSIKKAAQVIAVSHATASDIAKLFPVAKRCITIIAEGINIQRVPKHLEICRILKRYHINDRYLLYIGTLEPRKNIAGLIQTFDELVCRKPKRYKDVQLILAGQKGFQFQDNYKAIQAAKCGKIRYIGYISEQEKIALLARAIALVFPTFYEGFGLPVLEAMAMGTPVITSKVASLPSIVEQGGMLINPHAPTELQQAIDKLVSSKTLQQRLSRKGKLQAKKYSWKKCAKETLEIYRNVCERSVQKS